MSALAWPISPICQLFPRLDGLGLAELRKNIQRNGVLVPVTLWRGAVVDGSHRAELAAEFNLPCPSEVLPETMTEAEVVARVLSQNAHRRHLTKDQMASSFQLAVITYPEVRALVDGIAAEAKKRKDAGKAHGPIDVSSLDIKFDPTRRAGRPGGHHGHKVKKRKPKATRDILGAQVGVGGRTMARAAQLARVAPEQLPRVIKGEVSVQQALEEVGATKPMPRHTRGSNMERCERQVRELILQQVRTTVRRYPELRERMRQVLEALVNELR